MRLAEMRQDQEHSSPNSDKEHGNEDKNLPLWYRNCPEEAPVATVGQRDTF